MSARYQMVRATEAHAAELAVTMREADRREAWAAARMTPKAALAISMAASRDAVAGLADGRVACIVGMARPVVWSKTAIPWMLGSEELPQHAMAFLRRSKVYIERVRKEYPFLRNWVDARNEVAIEWLRWLGFQIGPATPYGPDDMPFHPFTMETV